MNTSANTSATGSGNNGIVKMMMGLVIFVLILVGLYYLYNFMYGSNTAQSSVDILTGTKLASDKVDFTPGHTAVSAVDVTGILDGGEYSTSFWVYVSDTKGFNAAGGTPLAHLMEISNKRFATGTGTDVKGNTLVYVGLNPINGTLVVRQSSNDPTEQINNSLTAPTESAYSLDDLTANYNTPNSVYTRNDRCDIINGIEYQRWILVTIVGNGKTLDVYIDGKLARSCVYKAPFALGAVNGSGTAYFGLDNAARMKGFFSSGKFYNYALTPDAIWALYQAGPGGSFNFTDFFSNLFSINVNFSSSNDLNK